MSPRALLAGVLLGLGAVSSACDGAGLTPPPAESRVDVDTPALREAKARARIAPCPAGAADGASDLPEVSLPCLGGGDAVRLDRVEGPAVVPLWASWCEPCKDELPLFARLAREQSGRLSVLGVDYQDVQPDLAIDLLRRSGARFPQVADPAGVLADHYRVRGLPGMLWVRADGSATFVNDRVTSYDELVRLVSSRLDVDVAVGGAG